MLRLNRNEEQGMGPDTLGWVWETGFFGRRELGGCKFAASCTGPISCSQDRHASLTNDVRFRVQFEILPWGC